MNISRRKFILNFGLLGITSFILGSCRRKSNDNLLPNNTLNTALNKEIVQCPTKDLSGDDIAIRNGLNYVDDSPKPSQNCANCKLYTLPIDNQPCGGCKILPGPVHPKGYCTAWIARM